MNVKEINFVSILKDYVDKVRPTDRLTEEDLRPILIGLFGEVGSIMTLAKKLFREKEAYIGYQNAVEEEFGDALWYLAALAHRVEQDLPELMGKAIEMCGYNDSISGSMTQSDYASMPVDLYDSLIKLGDSASSLFALKKDQPKTKDLLEAFALSYIEALQTSNILISKVVSRNVDKTRGRFLEHENSILPTFDDGFHEDERLPEYFKIRIEQRKTGRSYLKWNGVFIGDPLTDNILDPDSYKYHDVLHMAHAAILHWSPTFRALIKHKRKSDSIIDEAQDGGRAIVIEEGLTVWLFSNAKELNFFDGLSGVSFDLLKTIQQFVKGYEVEVCPLNLWEKAILQGYEVFRQVRDHKGGYVIGDRNNRTIHFEPLS